LDTTDLSVDVAFEEADDATWPTNVQVMIHLPHPDVNGRKRAILWVAERCPVHESICSTEGAKISLNISSPEA
jgi:hypothetical protein